MEKILAKYNKETKYKESLIEHTKKVINISINYVDNLTYDRKILNNFKENLMLLCILHDIGKCSKLHQDYMKNGKTEDKLKIYHNELSTVYYNTHIKYIGCKSTTNENLRKVISSCILYHHIIDYTHDKELYYYYYKIDRNDITIMNNFFLYMCEYCKEIFNISLKDKVRVITEDGEIIKNNNYKLIDLNVHPSFNGYNKNKLKENLDDASFHQLLRQILIVSDRIASNDEYDGKKILNNDKDYIKSLIIPNKKIDRELKYDLSCYDEKRLNIQKDKVKEIINSPIKTHVLNASAGYGKTLMGLLTFLFTKEKILWVTARNVIAENTYQSIIEELDKIGLKDKVKVALFYTNTCQSRNFGTNLNNYEIYKQADILVTNIDTMVGVYSKNDKSIFMENNHFNTMIFDEYHEFIDKSPLFSTFIHTMYIRQHITRTKTLLMSATAINLDDLWIGQDSTIKYHKLDIYGGDTKVKINVIDLKEINNNCVENSFTVVPTIDCAQSIYKSLYNENNKLLIHASYLDNDLEKIKERLYKHYGKNCDIDKPIIIGTNIIGVGLNISSKIINNLTITPENTIQIVCGRASRFCEYDEITYNLIINDDKNIENFIKNSFNYEIYNIWVNIIKQYDGQVINKKTLYDLYYDFYDNNKKIVKLYLESLFYESWDNLEKIKLKRGGNTDIITKLPQNVMTYRGDSNSYFARVLLSNGEYSDLFTIQDYQVEFEKKEEKDGDKLLRKKFIENNKVYKKPNKYVLKYKGITGNQLVDIDNFKLFANFIDTPLLLIHYDYNNELGLIKK